MNYWLVLTVDSMLILDFCKKSDNIYKIMSELGNTYKLAEETILKRYATELGPKGQSQSWKIAAIRDDREANRDSSILTLFAADVEAEVDRLLSLQPVAIDIPKKPTEPNKIAVEPPTPHGGLDLEWG